MRSRNADSSSPLRSPRRPAAVGLGDGRLQSGDRAVELRIDVEDGFAGADRARGQCDALDHFVGVTLHQHPVLLAARLVLAAVGHDVLRRALFGGRQFPLAPGWKAGPAASAQARCDDSVEDGARTGRAGAEERFVPAGLPVGVECFGPGAGVTRQEDRFHGLEVDEAGVEDHEDEVAQRRVDVGGQALDLGAAHAVGGDVFSVA